MSSNHFLASTLLLSLALAGCKAKSVSLTGTYGVPQGKAVDPVLRVSETKTGYEFEERLVGEWQVDPEIPHVATEAEVQQGLGVSGSDVPVFGLATHKAMLLKVPPGWQKVMQGRTVVTRTGYLLLNDGELFAAQKLELSGR